MERVYIFTKYETKVCIGRNDSNIVKTEFFHIVWKCFATYGPVYFNFPAFKHNPCTAQKIKFFIEDFFSKCDQIRRKLRIWLHLLK